MTGHDPIPTPGFELRRPPPRQPPAARRFLLIAAGLSVLVHLLAALVIVFLPRALPRDTGPKAQGTVELLMVEKQGNVASQPAAPEKPVAPPQKKPMEARKETETPEKAAQVAPSVPAEREATPPAPAPDPAPAPPARPEAAARPPQSAAAKAPVFDLTGTDSESNAMVLGGPVIPASQDSRYRNRPPVYPRDAQIRGETGTVEVLIHVTEAGLTGGVDLVSSSGSASLDRAAVDAVWKWHFRPALKEGRSVAFDLPFRFEFAPF
jgi:periplasmic protein TonB